MARWPIAVVCLIVGGLVGALIGTTGLQGQSPSAPAIPKELTSYRDIAKRVLPAVVAIKSKPKPVAKKETPEKPKRRPPIEAFPDLPEEFRKFFEDMEEMPDMPHNSFGSGFIIDPKGTILTNYHVVADAIAGANRVEVLLKDRAKPYYPTDIKGDRKNDLAIIRIKPEIPLPYLELGDSDAMEVGDRVLAAGAPFGLTGSITTGIVSAKSRSGFDRDRAVYEDYMQTDAAINPGNSGGPLVNLEGKVIGINTAIKTRNGGWQGVGLAITSNVAKNIVQQLERYGKVHRGYLGVQVGPLDTDVATRLEVPNGMGLEVTKVFENTPAKKAGIRAGDVIIKVSDKPIKDARELQHLVGSLPVGKPVDVTLIRDDKTKVVPVTIEEQPESYGVASGRLQRPQSTGESEEEIRADHVGLKLSDLTPELAKRYGYADDAKGVLITEVEPGGVAAEAAGLSRGVLIVKIDKKPVTSAASAQQTLQMANLTKGVLLQVQLPPVSGGGTLYRMLKAEPAEK